MNAYFGKVANGKPKVYSKYFKVEVRQLLKK